MEGAIQSGSISIINLLDEDSLNRIAESAGVRLWTDFVIFESTSAGILAIFIIIRIIKLVIDTLIHGYALHSVYGWSMHLLGAVWSSDIPCSCTWETDHRRNQQHPKIIPSQALSHPPRNNVQNPNPLVSVKRTKL